MTCFPDLWEIAIEENLFSQDISLIKQKRTTRMRNYKALIKKRENNQKQATHLLLLSSSQLHSNQMKSGSVSYGCYSHRACH